jgi:[acyl-carrier-protein] S-malonyltransferase
VRIGMLFPGQGSQAVGMGADLAAAYPEARAVFEAADAALGYDLSQLCYAGPIETLTETRHAQPALLAHSVAVLRILQAHDVRPSVVAGHSLGEFSALVAAGSLDFESALRIVRRRGELMIDAGVVVPGAMAAVVGAEPAAVQAACSAAQALGVCDIANWNAPDQVVLSGAVPAVEDAMQRLQAAGVRLVKRLNVSGAFHSALMQEPGRQLAAYLDEFAVRDAAVPVFTNVTGGAETRGAELRALLARQIHSPVRWDTSMRALRAAEPGPLLEVGAGTVLTGLLRRIDKSAKCTAVGDRAGLEAWLKSTTA